MAEKVPKPSGPAELHVRSSSRLRFAEAEAGDSADWLLSFDGRKLILPPKFSLDPALLAQHRKRWHPAA